MESKTTNALRIAVEHLTCIGYPKQNFGQFLAIVEDTQKFTEEEIERWRKNYYKTRDFQFKNEGQNK